MQRRILVAEDSPTQAERVRFLLESEGYEVEIARNGREGLARVAAVPPHLILSDVVMPELDGWEFCRAVKASPLTRDIPFVLLTDHRSPLDIIKGLELGADNFITKPFEDTVLLDRLRRIFEHLSTDRQQMFELLYSTLEEMSALQVEVARSQALRESEERTRLILDRQAAELEERVEERTLALATANEQLQQEVAERRRAEAEADRANRSKSEFLSRMSHELRTPLNGILGFGQLLEQDVLTPDQRESVEHILTGGRHLLSLINEVLELARIEAGKLSISPEAVSTEDVCRSALSLIRPDAAVRGIRLVEKFRADLYVQADRQRLQQVLLNLLSNGVKYTGEGGTVTMTCTEGDPGRVHLRVRDTGVGMAPAMLARLYTPFDRLGAEDAGIEGTGLGLALSKRLVDAMDGRLLVESEVGKGTTFTVDLAAAVAPAAKPTREDDVLVAPASRARGTVLYIEDNEANVRLLERVVRIRPGVTLLSAMLGSEGLEVSRRQRPDVILLDLHLPDLPGADVLARLREDARTRDIPVVVLSADATPGQIERLRAQGVREYLTKPVDVPRLLALLDELLAGTSV